MKMFLSTMLIFSLILNCFLTGCCLMSDHANVSSEIKSLALNHNIPIEGKSSVELLEEIERNWVVTEEKPKSQGEMTRYFGSCLTEEDWKYIRFELGPRPGTIETLEKYDAFIKEIKDRNLMIYPEE